MLYRYVPLQAAENVSYDASVASTAAPARTTNARIAVDSDCHYVIGTAPTATVASGRKIYAGQVEFVPLCPGEKIAFIKATGGSAGVANVCFVDQGG